MDIGTIPFNTLLGITVDHDSRGVLLACKDDHLNHLGSAHAGVVFAVAESASAHALVTGFPALEGKVVAVLRGTEGKYRRPASGTLRGAGHVADDDAETFVRRLASRGRAEITVAATVHVNDEEVFTGRFRWFVSGLNDEARGHD